MPATPEHLPWLQLMQTAYAVLGWAPQQFWTATPADYRAAVEGWRKRHQPEAMAIDLQHYHHLKTAMQKGNWHDGPE